jgi:hypothetical protein
MATGPDLRISDADRDAAAAFLREHYVQGRLSLEEFNQRLDAVFAATMQSQVTALTHDLPPAPAAVTPRPVTGTGWERAGRERRAGGRARLGLASAVIAALMTGLLLSGLHLLTLPWPAKLSILAAIFAIVRWLLRGLRHAGPGGRMGAGRYRTWR